MRFVSKAGKALGQLAGIVLSIVLTIVLTPFITYILLNINSTAFSLPQPTFQLTISLTPLSIATFVILVVAFVVLTRRYLVGRLGRRGGPPQH
jgi:membrane protein implicated in regulation of membrane protease activity